MSTPCTPCMRFSRTTRRMPSRPRLISQAIVLSTCVCALRLVLSKAQGLLNTAGVDAFVPASNVVSVLPQVLAAQADLTASMSAQDKEPILDCPGREWTAHAPVSYCSGQSHRNAGAQGSTPASRGCAAGRADQLPAAGQHPAPATASCARPASCTQQSLVLKSSSIPAPGLLPASLQPGLKASYNPAGSQSVLSACHCTIHCCCCCAAAHCFGLSWLVIELRRPHGTPAVLLLQLGVLVLLRGCLLLSRLQRRLLGLGLLRQ